MTSLPLRFHRETFDLLEVKPALDDQLADRLAAWQKTNGRTLPASLVEWYSHPGAAERVAQLPSPWLLFDVEEVLDRIVRNLRTGQARPAVELGCYEFQGPLVVREDYCDDPLVIESTSGDSLGECSTVLFRAAFEAAADLAGLDGGRVALWARQSAFSPPHLDYLLDRFQPGKHHLLEPSVILDELMQRIAPTGERFRRYCFFDPGAWVLLTCEGNPETDPCRCLLNVYAESENALFEAGSKLWRLGNFARGCRAADEVGAVVLKRLRRRLG